jgi:hypothetical protein
MRQATTADCLQTLGLVEHSVNPTRAASAMRRVLSRAPPVGRLSNTKRGQVSNSSCAPPGTYGDTDLALLAYSLPGCASRKQANSNQQPGKVKLNTLPSPGTLSTPT